MSKEIISSIIIQLLEQIGIADAKVELGSLGDVTIYNIGTVDSSLLIGRGGENLSSLQHLTYILANKQIEDLPRFMLDVNNYRQDKNKKLVEIAKHSAQKVIDRGTNELLRPMNSHERKVVHTVVSEYDNLVSTSVGEEPNRRVLIKKS